MNTILQNMRAELKDNSDERTRDTAQRFFKEKVKVYGVKTATVSQIGKKFFILVKDRSKTEIFSACDKLWRSGYLEESFIACTWSYFIRKKFEPKDFNVFEKWINSYVSNWASCDTFCNHTVGAFLELYPEHLADMKNWAKSKNRWMRRASAVSLIVPARQGKFLQDILEIADILLLDEEDLVQKGYGWMLKAASKMHQKEIFDYVMKQKNAMPRTAFRYALEKMPQELRARAMEK